MAHHVNGCVAWILLAAIVGAACGRAAGGDDAPATQIAPGPAQLEARIAELIRQLGAPEYATRERAQVELKRLRLDAFDALNEAQFSDDIEIAMSARYLVRSMQVTWASDDDSPEVKQKLHHYGARPENERRNLVDQLALMGVDQALRPLCRVVRYDASEKLSKHAALRILGLTVPDETTARQGVVEMLQGRMGESTRTAAKWLRAYALLLNDDPAAIAQWQELTSQEQARLVDSPDQTSREITRDLLKWFADQLTRRGQADDALAVMRKLISLLNSTPQEVLDAVDWFRERKSWAIVVEIAAQFPETFKRSPQLLYRLAETYSQLGEQQKAEQAAGQALAAIPDELDKHRDMADVLRQDGLFDSAEREYRHVAKTMASEPLEAIRANSSLSEMLHELRKDQAAGDALKETVDAVEANPEIRTLLETDLRREIGPIKSRMCFFYAEHEAQQGNTVRQRDLLLEGYGHDPQDVDLLIAMYRLPQADDDWTRETHARINRATEGLRRQIKELVELVNGERQGEDQAQAAVQLAFANNQLAWLAANTGGDADEAIGCSLKSLVLLEDQSGFLDTLGRCYYAKGDFANAVKYQSLAMAQEPHSPTMRAQLELFQKALQEQEAAKVPGDQPGKMP